MKKLYTMLKPFANGYVISLMWLSTILNFYLCLKPLQEYATSAGLSRTPIVLDSMNYYTPDEGYHVLSTLGNNGRDAYRLTNYADFVLPLLLFLSLSLTNMALRKGYENFFGPFLYMISDYIENFAEKYVLEIYPQRHDYVMKLACYAGLMKIVFFSISLFILITNSFKYFFGLNDQKKKLK